MRWPRLTRRDPEGLIECEEHGPSLPAFMCVHLLEGERLGFFHGGTPAEGESRPDAWCGDCEELRVATGGRWTEDNEPALRMVCGRCWDLIGSRNATGSEDPA